VRRCFATTGCGRPTWVYRTVVKCCRATARAAKAGSTRPNAAAIPERRASDASPGVRLYADAVAVLFRVEKTAHQNSNTDTSITIEAIPATGSALLLPAVRIATAINITGKET